MWKAEIANALTSARVAVLLVSGNFLASHFIAKHELPPLLNAARNKGTTIFWIYISSCLYEQTEIAEYQAAHDVSRPLDQLTKPQRQGALSEICARLLRTLQELSTPLTPIADGPHPAPPVAVTPAHLRCSLLVLEALKEARWVAIGGGPTTVLHRRLVLAEGWNKDASKLLEACRSAWSSELARLIDQACLRTLPPYLSWCHHYTPAAGEEWLERSRADDSPYDALKHQADSLLYEIEELLKQDSEFSAFYQSDARWRVLGFRDEADFGNQLYPGVERLTRNGDPMQRDFFERLLQTPEFTINQLHREGYRKDLVNDSVNALLTEKWAEWAFMTGRFELQGSFEDAQGRVTPVGQRMLRRLLDPHGGSAQGASRH